MPNEVRRRKWLARLFRRHGGRCTNCKRRVGILSRLPGWVLHHPTGTLISPTGDTLLLATIEHLTPRAKGGQWTWENLTLYCLPCNYASSHLGNPETVDTPARP